MRRHCLQLPLLCVTPCSKDRESSSLQSRSIPWQSVACGQQSQVPMPSRRTITRCQRIIGQCAAIVSIHWFRKRMRYRSQRPQTLSGLFSSDLPSCQSRSRVKGVLAWHRLGTDETTTVKPDRRADSSRDISQMVVEQEGPRTYGLSPVTQSRRISRRRHRHRRRVSVHHSSTTTNIITPPSAWALYSRYRCSLSPALEAS